MNEELLLLQKKHERLIKLVARMRHYQKAYVKYYARQDLDVMKRLQREVDKLIEEEIKDLRTPQKAIEFNT